MRILQLCLTGAILATCLLGPAHAEDCKPLTIIASLDMAVSGGVLVPAEINGTKKWMLVNTTGIMSDLTQQTVDELKLPTQHSSFVQYNAMGKHSDISAKVTKFTLGNLSAGNVEFMVGNYTNESADFGGSLAPNILRFYDVEFDFAARKFNLLSQDHCPGKVVYWPASVVAAVPMRVAASGHILIPVTLDGIRLQALITTASNSSVLSLRDAESDFHLNMGATDTPYAGPLSGTTASPTYRHKFKTLSFEGITINNPDFLIIPDLLRNPMAHNAPSGTHIGVDDENTGLGDIVIGVHELRQLHLYVAYKEQMLYITAASQPAQASGTTPAAH